MDLCRGFPFVVIGHGCHRPGKWLRGLFGARLLLGIGESVFLPSVSKLSFVSFRRNGADCLTPLSMSALKLGQGSPP